MSADTATAATAAPPCALCGAPAETLRLRWHKHGQDIVECPCCGLVARRLMPTADDLQEIYREDYFREPDHDELAGTGYRDYLADEPEHRLNAQRRLDFLERQGVRPRGRLLDIGCAAGFFLDEARRRRWEVQGIDVAPSMTRHAAEVLGLDVATAPVQEARLPHDAFEAVTMWDYLEHSIAPIDDLRAAARSLKPGGILALSTGDIGTPVAKASGSRWHLLTPEHHNFFFSLTTARRALESAGLEVVAAGHPPAWYSVGYLIHKLQTMVPAQSLGRAAARLQERPLGRRAIPMNLWDIMTVLARRPA